MDISNLTIPPNLFYSKNPAETWKPRCLSKITPIKISESTKKKQSKTSAKIVKKRKVFKRFSGPQLGRIEKVRNAFVKKKLIKKKTAILQEKSADNNNIAKLPTKKEEIQLQKEIKLQDQEILKRIYVDENHKAKAKRRKGSGFKFFKSKNSEDAEGEEHRSEEIESELVPEIRDFPPPSSADTSQAYEQKTENILNLEAFEDDAEPVIDGTIIESLLQNLDEGEAEAEKEKTQSDPEYTLDSLIGTLEGVESEEPKIEVKKQLKTKFMGLGNNQLQIDAGQSKFGLVECKECGFSYNTNVPEDEKLHNKHHQAMTTIPRFRGWNVEDSMTISEWSQNNGRVIHLTPGHKKIASEHVTEITAKMEMEFGAQDDYSQFHVYLAAYDSKVVGIATVKDSVNAFKNDEEKTIRLGVQRLFVRQNFRRKGIATAMLKTIAIMHHKGELLSPNSDFAFSSPTEHGKKLITSVTGQNSFFVFN